MRKEERQIIVAAGKGDQQSFRKLFETYYPKVFVLAMSKLRNKIEAEEAAQQTMITVWDKLYTLQTPEAFGGWISRIAINKCNEHLRKHSRTVLCDDNTILHDVIETDREVLPEAVADQNDLQSIVGKALESLSEEQREAVVLFYYNQLSIKEISEATGVTGNTIKSRLSLARKYLKSSLASEHTISGASKLGVEGVSMATLGAVLSQHFAALEPASEMTNTAYEQVSTFINNPWQMEDATSAPSSSSGELGAAYVNELASELRMCASVEIPLVPTGGRWPDIDPRADVDNNLLENYLQPIREYRERLESTELDLIASVENLLEKL